METPKRLTPTKEVTRRLYLASGNRCAYPNCDKPMMRADGVRGGKIAHIEGALPTSGRFNSTMTNEERRAYENLLLLCGEHHDVIDQLVDEWPRERPWDLKRKHEAIYTAAVDQLRQQVGDITEGVTFTPAVHGFAIAGAHTFDEEEAAWNCEVINAFAERLPRFLSMLGRLLN